MILPLKNTRQLLIARFVSRQWRTHRVFPSETSRLCRFERVTWHSILGFDKPSVASCSSTMIQCLPSAGGSSGKVLHWHQSSATPAIRQRFDERCGAGTHIMLRPSFRCPKLSAEEKNTESQRTHPVPALLEWRGYSEDSKYFEDEELETNYMSSDQLEVSWLIIKRRQQWSDAAPLAFQP